MTARTTDRMSDTPTGANVMTSCDMAANEKEMAVVAWDALGATASDRATPLCVTLKVSVGGWFGCFSTILDIEKNESKLGGEKFISAATMAGVIAPGFPKVVWSPTRLDSGDTSADGSIGASVLLQMVTIAP
jgi:hypothetical protein